MVKIPDQHSLRDHNWRAVGGVEHFDSGAMGAPGRAMQGLGQSIASLGASIGAQADGTPEQKQAEKFETAVKYQTWEMQFDDWAREQERNIVPNGDGFREGVAKEYDTRARAFFKDVPERLRGEYDLRLRSGAQGREYRARDLEYKQRDDYYVKSINSNLDQYGQSIDADPENASKAIERGIAVIEASPLPTNRKQEVIRNWGKAAEQKYIERRVEDIERRKGDSENPLSMEDVEKEYQGIENDLKSRVRPSWEGMMQPQGDSKQPSGPLPPIFDSKVPSVAERRQIFEKGGVVVNLDTNWAKGDKQTTPMVVIPDGATAEQRAAAESYAARVADVYKQQFGTSLAPRVVTRSENGRGRGFTIHTEPYSVNDSKAVEFFNSPEGRKAHAQILSETFGKVQGVHFSIPHNPDKGDSGAAGRGGNEVEFARGLLSDMRGSGSQEASNAKGASVTLSAYAPRKGASDVSGAGGEGSYAAARPGPDGKAEVRTLADVAAGRSQYVTIAGNPNQYGKSYTIPEISFVDANGKTQTLRNVKAVVHDTGSAFKAAPEGRFDVPIDRDADDKQMAASHAMWKKSGVQFVADDAPSNKAVRVADASGAVPQGMNLGGPTPVQAPNGQTVAEVNQRGQIVTLLDGIPDDTPLSGLPAGVREQIATLVPKEAEKSVTLPNGQKMSATDAVTVGDVKKVFESQAAQVAQAQGVPQGYKPTYQFKWLEQAEADKELRKLEIARRNIYIMGEKGEVERILRTGAETRDKAGRTFMERAADILTPNQMTKLRANVSYAKAAHEILVPVKDTPDVELDTYLDKIQDDPNDDAETRSVKARLQAKVVAEVARVRKLREQDPAESVGRSPEVLEALDMVKRDRDTYSMGTGPDGTPQPAQTKQRGLSAQGQWETMIEARIEAQERIFGERFDRTDGTLSRIRVVTATEAERLMGTSASGWKELDEAQQVAHLKMAAARADQTYGRYAKRAFEDAMRTIVSSASMREEGIGMAAKLIRGERITATDVHKYEQLGSLWASEGFAKPQPQRAPQGLGMPSMPAAAGSVAMSPASRPAITGGAPAAPSVGPAIPSGVGGITLQVAKQAAEWMMQDPQRRGAAIDMRFGQGASQQLMQMMAPQQGKPQAQPAQPMPVQPAQPRNPTRPYAG